MYVGDGTPHDRARQRRPASAKLPRTFILEYLMQSLVITVDRSLVFIHNLS